MTPKEKRQISNAIMEEIMELHLSSYHTIFLANMILEQVEHPSKKINELAEVVMKIMPNKYHKKRVIETSAKKSLEALEEELHDCTRLLEISDEENVDLFLGKAVKNIVLYFVNKVLKQYEE